MVLALYLQCYSTLLGHHHSLRRKEMIKSGRGSLKVGVVAKIFACNYTYNPTILKILDPPLHSIASFAFSSIFRLIKAHWALLIVFILHSPGADPGVEEGGAQAFTLVGKKSSVYTSAHSLIGERYWYILLRNSSITCLSFVLSSFESTI